LGMEEKRGKGTPGPAFQRVLLRRLEEWRMTNSGVLLPGTARHTFEGTGVMLVMERGVPERITVSLFNDRVRRHFKRQSQVARLSSAAECDGSDKMVVILQRRRRAGHATLQSTRHPSRTPVPQ
jgi:hypothetical protein